MMDIFGYLALDSSLIMEEYEKIASSLRTIGLTDYEAKTYVALVAMNRGTADEVSDMAHIPRTSTYKVLGSLSKKGYVRGNDGRPTVYHPVPPEQVREMVMEGITGVFAKLEAIEGILSEKGTPQLFYTISGRERVMRKIGEVIDSSMHRLILSTPDARTIRAMHGEKLHDAMRRGVEVIAVVEPFVKVPFCSRSYRTSNLLATDVISDGELALIGAPDLNVCGYTDNPFLARHLEDFVQLSIERLEQKD